MHEIREMRGIQERMAHVLGLHRTNSRVSLHSITSFAASINTKKAFKEFCKSLHQVGVSGEMINQKRREILNIFKPQDRVTSSQTDDGAIGGQDQLPVEDDQEEACLHNTAYRGLQDAVQILHSKGASIKAIDEDNNTTLYLAAKRGHYDVVELLLDKGALIRVINKHNSRRYSDY